MLYLHVNPRLSQESESQVTYTTITSISECFTFMWILLWVMDLNSKSHIQQLKALRSVFHIVLTHHQDSKS